MRQTLVKIGSALLVLSVSLALVLLAVNANDSGTAAPGTGNNINGNGELVTSDPAPSGDNPVVPVSTDMRGVWVASVLNIDYPSKPVSDPEVLKREASAILDNAKANGLNAVFLQVRPTSDALYKSQYFPWSKYLTGKQGLAPDGGFDPLEFWVTEAHNRGLELHAWINPYRITKKEAGQPNHDFASLDPSNPAKLHPEWVVKHTDGNLYYDPGIPEVRKLIVDGVLEIVNGYQVDGIHFDDYFYPESTFNDKATFAKYGAGFSKIGDWRRDNVNKLITDVKQAIRGTGKTNVRFGISPFGIWANKATNSLGSDTKGMESYTEHFADSRKWVKDGMIDYIMPQIYWNIGYSIADYNKLLTWWADVVRDTPVDLYIGQAAYREGNSSTSSAWYGVAEIEKQLKLNEKTPAVKGSVFYSYNSLAQNPALSAVIKALYEKRDGKASATAARLSRPQSNIRTSFSKFYLNGSSDPGKPLYLNGKPVENRSEKGYYGVLVPLSAGANVFTLSQEGSWESRVIYRLTSPSAQKMSKAEIPASSVFPQTIEYRSPGEKITLSCQAPIGSKVTVKVGGKTYAMKASVTKSPGTGIYPATYTYVYTVPAYTGTPRNVDLGKPVYTMKYTGLTKTRTAPASVGIIMKASPYFGEVTKNVIDTYKAPVSGDGAAYELYKGMTDRVTALTGSYARLASGQWVKKSDMRLFSLKTGKTPAVTSAIYLAGDRQDTVTLKVSSPSAAISMFDGSKLKLNVSATRTAALPVLPDNALFAGVSAAAVANGTEYTFTLKENARIDGYYIEKTSTGLMLTIKRHAKADTAVGPLSGITVMVDPGHGGSEYGALGPLGTQYAEKTINLNTSFKLRDELEKLGAKVVMTRTDDRVMSLVERLAASRAAKPDMFISIHSNSMEDNVDISKVTGFSAFYNNPVAKTLTRGIYDQVISGLNRKAMGVDVRNFYVMRGTWAPSLLLEGGFVPNPAEFEWLTDDNSQTEYAKTLAEAIAVYFAN